MNDASGAPAIGYRADEEEEGSGLFRALPSIAWQRRWLIIIPTVLLTGAGIAASYLISPTYRSEATLVIESQTLPTDVVAAPMTDVVDERIARVRQRVLSRPDLIQLIRQYNLYPSMQASQPLSAIIEKMRKNTQIQAVASDVGGFHGANSSTIAFTISFDYPDAAPAQLVVQQFVNNFLDIDARSRSEDAASAANFLGDQAASLQRQIQDVDGQITAIKAQNGSLLSVADNDSSSSAAADAARVDSEIDGLKAENIRLRALPVTIADGDGDVKAAEQALRVAQARYSDTHPDVVAAKAQLAAARAAAPKHEAGGSATDAEIQGNNARIASLERTKSLILAEGETTRAAQSRAPAVAERVVQLQAQSQGLREQYALINSKLQNAQVSSRMESENKGERLSLADPPTVPDEPVWPNRKLLIAGGLFGGIGLGLALSLLLELLFKPIRGTESLRQVTGRPPLVVIPLLDRKPGLLVRLMERLSRRRLAKRPRATA